MMPLIAVAFWECWSASCSFCYAYDPVLYQILFQKSVAWLSHNLMPATYPPSSTIIAGC